MSAQDDGGSLPQGQGGSVERMARQAMEQRRYERMRASLSIKYHLMGPDEESALEKQGNYVDPAAFRANTTETRDLNKLVNEDSATSEDISLGGLKISTPLSLPAGTRLWLEIGFPEVPIPVNAIAEVRWCRPVAEQWSSGLKFAAISKGDLDKVERFLTLQKRAEMAKRT